MFVDIIDSSTTIWLVDNVAPSQTPAQVNQASHLLGEIKTVQSHQRGVVVCFITKGGICNFGKLAQKLLRKNGF